MKKITAKIVSIAAAIALAFSGIACAEETSETTDITLTAQTDGITIAVSGDTDSLSGISEVSLSAMTDEELAAAAARISADDPFSASGLYGYNISFLDEEGNTLQPSGDVEITVSGAGECSRLLFVDSSGSYQDIENGTAFTSSSAAAIVGLSYETELLSGTYSLSSDFSGVSFVIPEGETVVINLNGYSLTGDGESSTFSVYGSLTVNGSGTVSGVGELGGAFYVSGDEAYLELNDVTVAGSSADVGGGIYIESGEAAFDNASVYGNSASTGAADIYIAEGASANLSGIDNSGCTLNGNLIEGWYLDDSSDRWAETDNSKKIDIDADYESPAVQSWPLIAAYGSYKVTYSPNDLSASGSVSDSALYAYGSAVTIMECTYTLEGYVFDSWNDDPYGEGTSYEPGDEITIKSDLVLYAQWKKTAEISFDANGGEGEMETLSAEIGEEIEAPECAFTLDGYEFVSWNTKEDGSGEKYLPGDTITVSEDMTLYAQWQEAAEDDADDDEDQNTDTEDDDSDGGSDEQDDNGGEDSEDGDDTDSDTEDDDTGSDIGDDDSDAEDTDDTDDDESENSGDTDNEADSDDDADDETDSDDDADDNTDDTDEKEESSEDAEEETFKVYIKTVDENGDAVSGAGLVLLTEDGDEILSWTSSYYSKGVELAAGDYIITEEDAPDGYDAADDICFTVTDEGSVSVSSGDALLTQSPLQISIVHEYETEKEVLIYKTGMGGNLLSGAVLKVYDEDGDTVATWTTGGSAKTLYLESGTYTLHEVSAPDCYIEASDIEFTVETDGDIYVDDEKVSSIKMEDEWTVVALEIFDGTTGEPITGAVLQVLTSSGTVIKEWTSDEDGVNRLSATLNPGDTYILHQVSATEGYAVAADISFTVSETSNEQYVIMKNYPVSSASSYTSSGGGAIQVTKTVTGTGADTSKLFGFILTLYNADGTPYDGTLAYVSSDGTSGTTQMTSAGQIGFELSHGGAITFYGIPEGCVYTVVELDYSSAGYSSSASADQIGSADGLIQIAFTNTYSASSVISVSGSSSGSSSGASYASPISASGSASSGTTGASITGTVSESYDTGDSSNMALWVWLLAGGALIIAALAAAVIYSRGRKNVAAPARSRGRKNVAEAELFSSDEKES